MLTRLALLTLAALTLAGAWALATAHTWPEWDERATDYDLEEL